VTDGALTLLRNPRDRCELTYLPAGYGNGRFTVLRELATAGQGYTLLVKDTWTAGYGVLKGIWWNRSALHEHLRSALALEHNNAQIRRGAEAVRRATELNQQAPVIVATVADPSPSLLAVGHPELRTELFTVQQCVGVGDQPARTLQELIKERADTNRKFHELELLDLASQLCDTLAALHGVRRNGERANRKTWVHADIKPGNILVLGPPWRYILIDYDGAVEQGAQIELTTDAYAPPRQAGGHREMEEAQDMFDIYMFGATLAEAAGLKPLDDAVRVQLYGSMREHTLGKRALRDLGYGPILTTVIASCLAPPKNARFSKAAAVAADLTLARNATVLSGLLTSDDWS
jgi:serine/threonine protein kinase